MGGELRRGAARVSTGATRATGRAGAGRARRAARGAAGLSSLAGNPACSSRNAAGARFAREASPS